MEGIELKSFQIISSVGEAKSDFILAIRLARKGDMKLAKEKMIEGEEKLIVGHRVHAQLLQEEAKGIKLDVNLLLVHAEDQLMNAETSKVNAEEFLYLYERIKNLEMGGTHE